MDYFRNLLAARKEEEGASAVEYGLLVAGIAAVIVLLVFAFGGLVKNIFSDTCSKITSQAGANSVSISASCS